MALPNMIVTGNLKDIMGDVIGSEIAESALSQARVQFVANHPPDAFIRWGDTLYRMPTPINARVNTDGDIVFVDEDGDESPVRLLAQDDGLNIRGLQWQVRIDIPEQVLPPVSGGRMRSWWIEAKADGETSDLKTTIPAVATPIYGVSPGAQIFASDILDSGQAGRDIVVSDDQADLWDVLGTVPTDNLPSYVDDVIEFADLTALNASAPGASGKIYVTIDNGDSFRWSGSVFSRISDRVTASGITDATTYTRGFLTDTDDASEARSYIQGPSYFRRARTVPDPNGTDDTTAIQAVFAEGAGEIVFRKGGTWIIDANPTTGMLKPLSNTRIIIEEGATVQVKTNALDLYYLFQLSAVQNVDIEGMGTLLGDALLHTGPTGQYGHLINITNSSDCRVHGPLKLTHAWGDGVYIGGGLVAACNDILIDGVVIDDCRREGVSPFWVDGCTIRDCRIVDIASTAFVPGGPGSGIDVEPNDGQYVNNLTIENNYIAGTAGNGMYISTLPAGGVAPYTTNVIIRDNIIAGCGVAAGGASAASGPLGFTNGIYVRDLDDPIIENNTILNSGFVGDTGFVSTGIKTNLCDRPVIKGNTVSGSKGAGILVTGGTTPEIVENTVRNNGQRGISTGVAGAVIRGNQVFDNNQSGGSSEHHVSITGDGCAVVGNVFRGSNGSSWVRISSGTDSLVANNIGLGTAPTNKLSDAGTTTRRSLNFRVATGVYESWDVTGATPVGTLELGHATDTTVARTAAGRAAIEGAEIITATAAAAITTKTTPVDADTTVTFDSAASGVPKMLSWANIKATLAAAWLNLLSMGTVIGIHNQADQTTNYERARLYWSSNAFTVETDAGGTGTLRDVQMLAANNQSVRVFGATQAPSVGTVRLRADLAAASGCIAGVNGTLSASSGVQYGLSVSPAINETSTGGYTALLINVTQTATGSGAKKLIDAQVGGATLFSVDNAGNIEVGHASDTTVSRYAAGVLAVQGALISTKSVTPISAPTTLSSLPGREFVYLLGTGAVPTLPTAAGSLSYYVLKNTTAGTITVSTTSSQTIEGSTTYVLAAGESIDVVSDQANWRIV